MVTIAYPPGRWGSEESQLCSVKTAAGKTAQVHNRVLIWLKKKKQKGNKDNLWVKERQIFPLAPF